MINKILSFIPGYRTKKIWKMIIASLYYSFSLLGLTSGIGMFLILVSFPFFFFGIIDAIRYKAPKRLLITAISVVVMVLGVSIVPSPQIDSAPTPSPSPSATATDLPSATPEPTPTPTPKPTSTPTIAPTPEPTAAPTIAPAPDPTTVPVASTKTGASASSGDSNTQASSAASSSGATVYVGNTGTKYHRESCSTLKGKGHAISLEKALSEGREPCKRCKP